MGGAELEPGRRTTPPEAARCEGCDGLYERVGGLESRQSAEGAGKNRLEATPPPRPYTCEGCDGLSGAAWRERRTPQIIGVRWLVKAEARHSSGNQGHGRLEGSACPVDEVSFGAGRTPKRHVQVIVGHVVREPSLHVHAGSRASIEHGSHAGR